MFVRNTKYNIEILPTDEIPGIEEIVAQVTLIFPTYTRYLPWYKEITHPGNPTPV